MESKARFLIKIFFGNDNNIRRYSFDQSSTWAGFYETFKQLFRAEYNSNRMYKFEYVDPEGDRVVIDSDVEWQEMIYLYKDASIIKLHVTELKAQERLLPPRQEKQVELNNKSEQQEKAREEGEKKLQAEKNAREEAKRKARDAEEKELVAREEQLREVERKYMLGLKIAREEAEKKAREDAEKKAREDAEKKAREDAEKKAREDAEKKAREDAEKKAHAEKEVREEKEKRAREEAEKKAHDAEEKTHEELKLVTEDEEAKKAQIKEEAAKTNAVVQKYTPQLHQLFELGFKDVPRNLKLLVTFNGRLEEVINTLLS